MEAVRPARRRPRAVRLPQPRLPAALVGAHGIPGRRRRVPHSVGLADDDAHGRRRRSMLCGAQRRAADDGDRRHAGRPLLATAADDLLGPRQGRDRQHWPCSMHPATFRSACCSRSRWASGSRTASSIWRPAASCRSSSSRTRSRRRTPSSASRARPRSWSGPRSLAICGVAGSAAVFGINALTFLVSAALLLPARPRSFEPEPSGGRGSRSSRACVTSRVSRGCGWGSP